MRRASTSLRFGWICLLVVGVGILVFGLVMAVVPASGDEPLMRADGLASIGLGLFGVLTAVYPVPAAGTLGLVRVLVLPGVLDVASGRPVAAG